MKVKAENLDGFGRIVLTFTDQLDLPGYETGWDNGVLVVTFDQPIATQLPELSGTLPRYVTAARIDPDNKGLRIGLKEEFRVNKTEAGEHLFIDLLPAEWVGLDPGLPREIVEELSHRARYAAEVAEQKRKARVVAENTPDVRVRVGRHPTFVRLSIGWSIDVEADYAFDGQSGTLAFDWPVPIPLYELQSGLPAGLRSINNEVDESGSLIKFSTVEGLKPRFYANSAREFIIDLDVIGGASDEVDLATLMAEGETLKTAANGASAPGGGLASDAEVLVDVPASDANVKVTPFVETVGSTVRVVFPFERDVAAAVFRRADALWMVFDTAATIGAPDGNGSFAKIASEFTVMPTGDTSVVRMKLASDRLATLGSEGRSWVLSIGDLILSSGEHVTLDRRQTENGLFEITADLQRPARVHQLRDPEVGDVLEVVTVFPPARGIGRNLAHVDFTALRSVHGLVVRPTHPDVVVSIEDKLAVITAKRGLIVSAAPRQRDANNGDDAGGGDSFAYADLNKLYEPDIRVFNARTDELMVQAANAERRELDVARLELGKFYLANKMSYEALGVLNVLNSDLNNTDMADTLGIMRAAAMTSGGRWDDALEILNTEIVADAPDAMMWRTIARNGAGNFEGARRDALVAEPVVDAYPQWVRISYYLAAMEAAIETGDFAMATRLSGTVDTAHLDAELQGKYGLLTARIDEASGRFEEALDTYGQVIAADIRPTRAEAIYRTLQLLDEMGRLDSARAVDTLAAEAMVWRGNGLEAKMMRMLGQLEFRNGSFRAAFEVMHAMSVAHPDSPETEALFEEGKVKFANLYLNGEADSLPPIEALALYYDFRNLTPIGTRGDEMVRNLARRLVRVDLLEQAADLLQYQVDSRLEGAAKSQVAADLAIIYLANRQPDKALKALNGTRFAGLPPGLERQRRILEARALVDAGREDLALDILSRLDGRDTELLRIDAHWRAKRYSSAGEILEKLYTPTADQKELSRAGRLNVIKAAVAYVLDNDRIGVGRLRERYSELMAKSPEWPLFDFVTGTMKISSVEFRKIAAQVAGADTLNAFLSIYGETYGSEGALSPNKPIAASDA